VAPQGAATPGSKPGGGTIASGVNRMVRYATFFLFLPWLTLMTAHLALSETPTPPTASGDDMQPGEVLPTGHSIRSSDGRYSFVYQGDGNLVLCGPAGPLWASNTAGRSVGTASMQGDGNLVLHGSDSAEVWDSATATNPDSHLVGPG
jgi:hypothetical protein